MSKAAVANRMDGTIQHTNAVRLYVQGYGELDIVVHGTPDENGDTYNQTLVPPIMTPQLKRSKTVYANFRSESFCVEVSVDVIDEYFLISTMDLFSRPVENQYPQ